MRDQQTSFGYETIPADEKQSRVNAVFSSVAQRYDVMNDLMSARIHHLWKDALVTQLDAPRKGNHPWRIIDVAGGTGDIAFRIARRCQGFNHITVADINFDMVHTGHNRTPQHAFAENIDFITGNAETLPFPDNYFDAYTIAFGLRNVPDTDLALREALRVLRPGGKFLCLEFSQVVLPVLDKLYDLYSFHVIPRLGQIVAGDGDSYKYLVESIRKFPNQYRLEQKMKKSGFHRVGYENFTGGIVALHRGVKF